VFSSKYTAQEISGVPLETVRLRYELVVECGAGPREHATGFDGASLTLASGTALIAFGCGATCTAGVMRTALAATR
jgi:hypothetical protein